MNTDISILPVNNQRIKENVILNIRYGTVFLMKNQRVEQNGLDTL
jgi:hypothetical protein